MNDQQCVEFLQWALPQLRLRWGGFRKVRRQVRKRIDRRIRQLGLEDVAQYRALLASRPAEWAVLERFCRISISRFYRDRGVFDHLAEHVLPALARAAARRGENQLRLWCAGCATGEEVYTLAILWHGRLSPEWPQVRLSTVATDADEQMLHRARRACYQASSLKDVPREWLDAAFTRRGEAYVLRPQFASGIEFRREDIRSELPRRTFHLVLCRNLAFTYFEEQLQREVLRRIVDRLLPDGVLVIGKQESLPVAAEALAPSSRNLGIYRAADVRRLP